MEFLEIIQNSLQIFGIFIRFLDFSIRFLFEISAKVYEIFSSDTPLDYKLVVTCTADCTCHHLTNSRKKLKFPGVRRNFSQIWEFSNPKCSLTFGLKVFFVQGQRNIQTWLYVPLTGHKTI